MSENKRPSSEELLRRLQLLEEDYTGQPPAVQQTDLGEINRLRSQLGMPLVNSRLIDHTAAAQEVVEEEAQTEPEQVRDHTQARELYQAYLRKAAELEAHRAYAEQVAQATAGHGQTPVRPLATMGTNGGPLLCDHCGKPILLEGGRFHGLAADVAWKQYPVDNWTSWILGGMVVEILTNGTLRIYHGYQGRPHDCCEVALRERHKERDRFESGKSAENASLLRAFLEDEFPAMTEEERFDLLGTIMETLYWYDPGVGINRPTREIG